MSEAVQHGRRRIIVVAYAQNRVIGRDNAMPWQMSSDQKHFKAVTMGRPMIMGRKTYLSIGKPLPGRTTIVVTRDPAFAADGVLVAPSLEVALELADDVAARTSVDEVMIVGGGEIYAQAMPFSDRVIATEIALAADGSVSFPELDQADWHEVSRTPVLPGPRDDAGYDIVIYDRLLPARR